MPTLYALKPTLQRLVRPLVRALARAGVTANQVTLAAILLAAAAGGALAGSEGHRIVLLGYPLVVIARLVLNTLDGMLAREHGQASALGAILNEMGDVFSDTFMYLPLAFTPALPTLALVSALLLGLLTEMIGVVSVQVGASRRYDGPTGKSDRAAFFGLVALSAGLGHTAWVAPAAWIVTGLSALTVLRRARAALRELEAAPR